MTKLKLSEKEVKLIVKEHKNHVKFEKEMGKILGTDEMLEGVYYYFYEEKYDKDFFLEQAHHLVTKYDAGENVYS